MVLKYERNNNGKTTNAMRIALALGQGRQNICSNIQCLGLHFDGRMVEYTFSTACTATESGSASAAILK
ncbi:hypothetical protein [Lysinibacillus sp. CTST325]